MSRCLLHIGYAKAGSSFLQGWFAAHPDLVYRHQALHGFSRSPAISDFAHESPAQPAWFVTSDEDFAFWKGPLEPVGLRMRPYDVASHQERVCRLLHDLMPQATVLIVTRGFVSIPGSAYSQYVRAGGRLGFAELVEESAELMAEFWNYDYLVGLYRETFGAAQVIVLPYELLQRDSDAFLRGLAARLGVEHHPVAAERVNPALDRRTLERLRRLSVFLTRALAPLPAGLQRRLYATYTRRLTGERVGRWLAALRRSPGEPGLPQIAPIVPPDALLTRLRGRAARLCREPVYAEFRAAYLEEPTPEKVVEGSPGALEPAAAVAARP